MEGQALFDKIVALSGVSAVLAPGLVRRALLDGKVRVEDATPADYRAALPRILARLRAYMEEEEAQRRARRIAGMLAQVEAGRALDSRPPSDEDESEWSLIGRVTDALRGTTPAEGSRRPTREPSGPPSARDSDAPREPRSGETPLDEWDEVTLMGRRYTAHEREVVRKSGPLAVEPLSGEKRLPGSGEIRLDSGEVRLDSGETRLDPRKPRH